MKDLAFRHGAGRAAFREVPRAEPDHLAIERAFVLLQRCRGAMAVLLAALNKSLYRDDRSRLEALCVRLEAIILGLSRSALAGRHLEGLARACAAAEHGLNQLLGQLDQLKGRIERRLPADAHLVALDALVERLEQGIAPPASQSLDCNRAMGIAPTGETARG